MNNYVGEGWLTSTSPFWLLSFPPSSPPLSPPLFPLSPPLSSPPLLPSPLPSPLFPSSGLEGERELKDLQNYFLKKWEKERGINKIKKKNTSNLLSNQG